MKRRLRYKNNIKIRGKEASKRVKKEIRGMMTIGQLKRRLINIDVLVVRSGPDHSYFETYGTPGLAESNEGGYWEYYGKEHMAEDSVVIDVFIID